MCRAETVVIVMTAVEALFGGVSNLYPRMGCIFNRE